MLTNTPHPPKDDYQAAIALMQAYDCSYEDAQRHLQLLNAQEQGLNGDAGMGEEEPEEDEVLGAGEQMVTFTPKELRVLRGFFSGTLSHSRPARKASLCGQACQRLKTVRRKLKCLKYLNPSRVWRAIERRRSASYKKITSVELNASTGEQAKARSSWRWREVEDEWAEELEGEAEELALYLAAHRELAHEVRALTGEGARVAVPATMALPPHLRPLLFLRRAASEEIAENVKIEAEQACRVVCLEDQQFNRLFLGRAEPGQAHSVAVAAYNIFEELQVLALYGSSLSAEQVQAAGRRFKEFVIKNRLFKSILERDLDGLSFTHQHQQQEEERQAWSEQEEGGREAETHQSIIREQDTLYQSMLSTYTARETEKEAAGRHAAQLERQRQALRESLREEPSPCPASTLQLTLRTPSGTTLARHFLRADSLQYLKDWISVCEEVEFEGAGGFELCHGYPPLPLQAAPSDSLGAIFGSEAKVRLIIKET